MKKKLLIRINLLLGSAIFSLLGMTGCFATKYGIPYEEEYSLMYGPAPDYKEVVNTTSDNPVAEE